jgi:hypothetical protein
MMPMEKMITYTAASNINMPPFSPIPTLLAPIVAWLLSTLALHMGHWASKSWTRMKKHTKKMPVFFRFCTVQIYNLKQE